MLSLLRRNSTSQSTARGLGEDAWIRALPRSPMEYPESFRDKVKYMFWRLYTPLHPLVRDLLLFFGIVKHEGQRDWLLGIIPFGTVLHEGRQDWLLGTIAPDLSIQEFVSYLLTKGYGNHFVAWEDEGELVSLRLTHGFAYQYHVRVFKDREVRAHYEYTPECYPFWHMKDKDIEPRREYFLHLLGSTILASE